MVNKYQRKRNSKKLVIDNSVTEIEVQSTFNHSLTVIDMLSGNKRTLKRTPRPGLQLI